MIDCGVLAGLPLLAEIPRPVLAQLAQRAVELRFDPGQVLYTAGTVPAGLFVVVEGRVRVVRGRGDRQHLVHEEGPGGALGEVPVFCGGTYPATAIAAEPTRCLLLLTEALRSATRSSPEAALIFVRRLGERTRHLVSRIDSLASQRVNARLAGLLLDRQRDSGAGIPFGFDRTQMEVAEQLGTVREVLVRALRQLRQAGVIESAGRGQYLVLNEEALERLLKE